MSQDKIEDKIKRLDIKLDKLKEKDKSIEELETYEGVLDKFTLKTLYDIFKKGYLTRIFGVISTGKEASVYLGKKGENNIAVKIYRTSTLDFKKMQNYILGDPRFKKIKKNTKSLIYAWAMKEYKNLKRAYTAGVKVPNPLYVKNNILLMEFIGDDGNPAPLLRKAKINDPEKVYDTLVEDVKLLYNKAKLVHADLSEFNILYFHEPVIIDMSQALLTSHPMAREYLKRDIKNLINFFKSFGLELNSESELLNYILRG